MHLSCLDDDSPSAGKATVMATEASTNWGGLGVLPPIKVGPGLTLESLLGGPIPPSAAGSAPSAGLPVFYEQPEDVPSLLGDGKAAAGFGSGSLAAEETRRDMAARALSGSAASGTATLIGGEHSLGCSTLPAASVSFPMPGRGVQYGGIQNPMAIDFVGGGKSHEDDLVKGTRELSVSQEEEEEEKKKVEEEGATMLATEGASKTTTGPLSGSASTTELSTTASSAASAAVSESVESAASKISTASRLREEAL